MENPSFAAQELESIRIFIQERIVTNAINIAKTLSRNNILGYIRQFTQGRSFTYAEIVRNPLPVVHLCNTSAP